MHKFIIGFILAFFALTVSAAEPLRWVGVPVFYSKFVPKIAPCTYDADAQYGFCGWKNYPEDGEIGVATMTGDVKESYKFRLYDEVLCVAGKCATSFGEPRGALPEDQAQYWYIPKGFYLTTLNGVTTAVKYGNGPLGNKYPIRAVKELPAYPDVPDGISVPEAQDALVYDVWCNVAQECSYMGREFSYKELSRLIPKRLTTNCDSAFCFTPEGRVAGLNPKAK